MLDVVALFAVATLLGGMATFSFLFAPLVFLKLPGETAGGFIRQVFPWYYVFVTATAAVAGVALIATDAWRGGAMLAVAALGVIAREVLMPAINAARDRSLTGEASAAKRFDWLHRASVGINFVQLIAAGVVLASFAA